VPGYAADEAFACSREAFAATEAWLGGAEAAALGHAALEEQVCARGRELQRLQFQAHLDLRAAREERRRDVTGPDGSARPRAERGRTRLLSSVFGPVTVSRIAYRAPGMPDVHPADAELGLPPGRHSHGLRKLAAAEAARGSFGQAAAAVAARTGSRLGKRQGEEQARLAAADFAGFYASRTPPAAPPGDVLVLECDGKGIVVLPGQMRPEQQRKSRGKKPKQPDGRLSRGETRNRRRMAEAAAVFDVTPVPRSPDGIMRPPGAPGPRPRAPRAKGKWVPARNPGTAAAVVAAAFAEADRRDPARERTWTALADGNPHQIARIQAEAAARDVTVTIVVDFMHVIEHLWDAAWCFCPEASPEAGPWVRAHAAAILAGGAAGAGGAAAAIRAAAASAGDQLSTAKARAAAAVAAYLDNKAPFLDYPKALAAGWPISTGVIEGTCRHLVKDRMDITGARWGIQTAEAVLQLRALHANGDFDDYWKYHLEQEHQRNHPGYTLAA
jgi:hypothetical protein